MNTLLQTTNSTGSCQPTGSTSPTSATIKTAFTGQDSPTAYSEAAKFNDNPPSLKDAKPLDPFIPRTTSTGGHSEGILDDSDDLDAKLLTIDEPKEPVELENGPLLFIEGDKVQTNLPALAEKFAADHSVAYSTERNSFFVYDTGEGVWVKETNHDIMWLVSSFVKSIAFEKKAIVLLTKRTPALVKSIMAFAQGCAPMGSPPPSSAQLVAVANGVLDLSGKEPVLLPHRKEYYFTSKIPVAYDPEAKCPRFLAELLEPALPDKDDIGLLQRDWGRMLVPGNRAQRFGILSGRGGSGKSLAVSVFERIQGVDRIAHLRTDKLNTRFETHNFQGRDLLVAKDVAPDFLAAKGASVIKSLTGGDRFETEKKYGGKFAMRGSFYTIITSNSRLPIDIKDDETAWRRRILFYEFSRANPGRIITDFEDILVGDEGEGILTWLIEGYFAHRCELEEYGDFQLTEKQKRRIENLVLESQGNVAFLKESISRGEGNLSVEEIFQKYVAYCRNRGWTAFSHQRFCKELAVLMPEHFDSVRDTHITRNETTVRGYKGVVFTAEAGNVDAPLSVAS